MLISLDHWKRFKEEKEIKQPGEAITLNDNLNMRLEHLQENLRQEWQLLNEYENLLRYEDDPRRRAKYRQEIERQRNSIVRYHKEYRQLKGHVSSRQMSDQSDITIQMVSNQIQKVNTKLDVLQVVVHNDLATLRKTVLGHYEEREKVIIDTITSRLDRIHLAALKIVFDALEANRLSNDEMRQTLQVVGQSLALLPQQILALPNHSQVAEVINSPQLDIRHKFEVALPIIPLLLQYKGEIELGSGINLEECWKSLVSKIRGNRSH